MSKKQTATQLAERIADVLFTDGLGAGRKIDRLVLTIDGPHGSIDRGGLCRNAVVGLIEKILKGATTDG